LDATDGKARWTAYTGGAMRYPPAVADGRAFFGSGDGYAYAFEAATGRLLWRFRAAPVERRIRVYDSLLSTWPVAGGMLVHDGVAYCAAGINNYDGTHVYALNAADGKIKWQNNGSGSAGPSLGAGVAVQGDLLLDDGKLYLAGGSAGSPAVFDTTDGKCLSTGQKGHRGRELHLGVRKDERGQIQRIVQTVGQPLYASPDSPVFERNKKLEWGVPVVRTKSADLLCCQTEDGWKLVAQDPSTNKDLWQQPLPAEPVRWAVAVDARGRVVVTLRNGQVLCFGGQTRERASG
jgi:outer membrane protein assembly factor BamB